MLDVLTQSWAIVLKELIILMEEEGCDLSMFCEHCYNCFLTNEILNSCPFSPCNFRNTCVVRIRALSFMVGGFCLSHFVEEERGVMVVDGCNSGKAWEERSKMRSIYFVTLCNQNHYRLKITIAT
jgi:hypothetical protein